MSAYLAMWGLFTGVMFLGTLRLSRALQVVFGTLTLLFSCWRMAITVARVRISNISPATKGSFAAFRQSTPARASSE